MFCVIRKFSYRIELVFSAKLRNYEPVFEYISIINKQILYREQEVM